MADLNTTFFLSLIIIVLGYTLKRLGILSQKGAGKELARLIFYVTLPAVILKNLTTADMDLAMTLLPFFAPIITAIIILVSYFIHKGRVSRENLGLYMMMSLGFNVGNFGFPLFEGIFGADGVKYAAMFDIGNAIVIFCVCYIIAVYFSPKNEHNHVQPKLILKKVATSPPMVAYIIAIILAFLNISLPWLISDVIGVIAQANHFIVYLVLGIYLNFNLDKKHWKGIFKVLITRYAVGLTLGLLFYFILPINELARTVLLICYILPVGMAMLVYVVQYEYDENFAGMMSNLNIIISFGLMWLILFLIKI